MIKQKKSTGVSVFVAIELMIGLIYLLHFISLLITQFSKHGFSVFFRYLVLVPVWLPCLILSYGISRLEKRARIANNFFLIIFLLWYLYFCAKIIIRNGGFYFEGFDAFALVGIIYFLPLALFSIPILIFFTRPKVKAQFTDENINKTV